MKRIYHHCDKLEEGPMWEQMTPKKCDNFAEYAAQIMKEPDVFKECMLLVLKEWPYSCEHNLSARVINRKAWLGHAGCFLGCGSPEICTRSGWWQLNCEEQAEANRVAQEVIEWWELCQK